MIPGTAIGSSAPPVRRPYDGTLSDDAVPPYSDGLQFPTDDCPWHDDALQQLHRGEEIEH